MTSRIQCTRRCQSIYVYNIMRWCRHVQSMPGSIYVHTHTLYIPYCTQIYEVVQACMKAMPHVTSTRELPPQIPIMPTDTRSKVIHELYTTEYTYVASLETLSEVGV